MLHSGHSITASIPSRWFAIVMVLMMVTSSPIWSIVLAEAKGDPPPLSLSLEEAVELALKNNRTLQTSRRSLSLASSNYRAAKAQYYPTLRVGYTASQTTAKADEIAAAETLYGSGAEINLEVPLDLSGAINRSVQQALISLTTAKANYVEASQGLVVNVYEEYYSVLSGRETLKIDQAQVSLAEDQLAIAEARLSAGRVPEVDVLTAKVQLNNERQNLKTSEGQLEIRLSNLRKTLLLDQESSIVPTSSIDYEPEYFNFRDALAESLNQRLEIEIATLNVESARIGLKSTYDPYRPTLNVTGNYGYYSTGDQVIDAFVNDRLSDPRWSVTTSISVPIFIFDGGVIRESSKRATITLQQAEADLAETKEAIELELRNQLTSLENARERVKIVQDTIALAKESLRITELRYRMGKTSYLELVDGRNNLRTAELNLLSAKIEHNLSKIRVHRALGRPLTR
jgi:outer membrane protein